MTTKTRQNSSFGIGQTLAFESIEARQETEPLDGDMPKRLRPMDRAPLLDHQQHPEAQAMTALRALLPRRSNPAVPSSPAPSEPESSATDLDFSDDDEDSASDADAHKRLLHLVADRKGHDTRPLAKSAEDAARPQPSDGPMTLERMLASLKDMPNFNELKKSIRRLEKTSASTADGAESQPVQLPLAASERVERAAAYGRAKQGMHKWQALVKRNREQHGVLKFPMNAMPTQVGSLATEGKGFRAMNTFEKEIEEILEKSGVADERQAAKSEELELKKLSAEEVMERRKELAKMRSIMFHHEKKMKRIKKIKSKKYRKIHKRQKERKAELVNMSELDPIQKAMVREKQRAEERMSLRHKNTSQWIRRKLQRQEGKYDEGTRAAIEEQLRKGQELRQKMASGETNSDQDSDAEEDEIGDEAETIDEVEPPSKKGLFGLKFMERAAEKQRDLARRSLEENEDDEDAKADEPVGRQRFTGTKSQGTKTQDQGDKPPAEEPRETGFQTHTKSLTVAAPEPSAETEKQASKVSADNPWLKPSKFRQQTKDSQLGSIRRSDAAEVPWIKSKDRNAESRRLVREAFAGAGAEAEDFAQQKEAEIEEDLPSEGEVGDQPLPGWGSWTGAGVKPSRREVARRRTLKQQMADARDAAIKKRADSKAHLRHVILNERRLKRAAELTVSEVPFPHKTREQYEASLAVPLGKEWQTASTYRRTVTPAVQVKAGAVILPLKFGGARGSQLAASRQALA